MTIQRLGFIGGGALFLPAVIILTSWYPGQLIAGLILVAFLPGYALLSALWPTSGGTSSPDRVEEWLLALPASFGLTITALLLMVFIRLPLNAATVSLGLGGLALVLTFIAWKRRSDLPSGGQSEAARLQLPLFWLLPVLLLLVAAVFRMTNLHYSDQQGDEADILFRAVSLLYGRIDAILTHSKGPGEILILNAIGGLTGRFDELTARLPFAVAGTVAVGLIFLVGWRLFNHRVGVVAGLLAGIDGVFVSYARTAQYQSVVLLLTLATIYAFYRFYRDEGQGWRWHGLGSFLLAASFLFHFETVLLLPVAGYLTFFPALNQKEPKTTRQAVVGLARLWPSLLIFLLVTASFYLPFALHPNLAETGSYLENRISGGSLPPFNNLAHFFYFEALKYNSAYYVVFFNLLMVLAGAFGLVQAGPNRLLTGLAIGCILGGLGLAWLNLETSSALALAVGMGLLFALVIFSSYTPLAERMLWLWIVPPFWVYVFLVNRPGKHHYFFLAALLVLLAAYLTRGWERITTRWPVINQPVGRGAAGGLGLVLFALFGGHSIMVLLRTDLEYVLTYPEHKSAVYPTDGDYPYGTRIGFGYPFRLGWQTVGKLKRTGHLEGTWAGNDGGNAPNWYMLGKMPTVCYPRYVLQGEITYKGDESFDVPFDPAKFGYVPRYRIWGNDRLRMTILEFDPTTAPGEGQDLYEPFRFDRPVTAADFAPVMSPPAPESPPIVLDPPLVLGEGSELKNNAPPEYLARAQQLEGRVALVGYDLEEDYARAGSILPLTLYWQSQNLLSLRYKVFVHLVSPWGQVVAQADDFPVCGRSHANTWTPGELVLDRHLLKLPPDLAAGDYTIIAGMYEPELNLRLNFFDIAGNEQGNSLTIGTVTIHD